MREDKPGEATGQEQQTPENLTEALFGPYIDQCWVTCGTARDKATWKGHFYRRDRVDAFDPDHGHYFCIALPKKGARSRDIANFEAGRLIVVDDVGIMISDDTLKIAPGAKIDIDDFRLFAPKTNYEVETSLSNFQMGYVIEPVERDFARWSHFINEMKKHLLFGRGFEDCTPVHYVRMETGRNQPKTDPATGLSRPRFRSRLAKPYDGESYTLDELAGLFGIDMSVTAVAASLPTQASGETCSGETLKKILGLLPNDTLFDARVAADGKPCWVSMGAAIRNITGGSDEGLALWLAWCGQRPQDPGAPEALWESVHEPRANAATLRRWVEAKYGGAYSREYQLIAADIGMDQAQAAFEEVADEGLTQEAAAAAEDRKAEAGIDELLRQLAAARPIPDLYDPRNALAVPRRFDAASARGVARPVLPVVLGGLRRGRAAMLTAMPSAGKSTYTILAATAICHEDPGLAGEQAMVFPGDVVVLSNEDEEELIHAKLEATEKHFGLGADTLQHGVTAFHRGWKLMARSKSGKVIPVGHDFLRELIKIRREGDIALIVIDTMSSVMAGLNENDNQEMQAFSDHIEAIAKAAWAAVLVIHHLNKGAMGKDGLALIYGARGASSVPATFRTMLALSTPSEQERTLYAWTKEEARAWVKLERSKLSRGDPRGSLPRWFHFVSVPMPALNPDGSDTTEDFGILEERTPQPGVTTIAGLQAYLDKLVDVIRGGVAVYALKTKSKNKVTVFEVLGLTAAAADDVVSTLSSHRAISVGQRDKRVLIDNEKALEIENAAF